MNTAKTNEGTEDDEARSAQARARESLEEASGLLHDAALAAHLDDEWADTLGDLIGSIDEAIGDIKATK